MVPISMMCLCLKIYSKASTVHFQSWNIFPAKKGDKVQFLLQMSHIKTGRAVLTGRNQADFPYLSTRSCEHQRAGKSFCSLQSNERSKKQLLLELKLWGNIAQGFFPALHWFSPWANLHVPSVKTKWSSSHPAHFYPIHAHDKLSRAETCVYYFSTHKGPSFNWALWVLP